MAKKRIYQLGEVTVIKSLEIFDVLLAKNGIIRLFGQGVWDNIYKDVTNKIRKKYNFDYRIGLAPGQIEGQVGIIVFESKYTDTLIKTYRDKDLDKFYIEVDE